MLQIEKRDKRIVQFNKLKIENAILKAFKQVDGEVSEYALEKASNIADYIEHKALQTDRPLTVEEIQDLVENGLMATKRKDVARAYITYREKRTEERNWNSSMMLAAKEKLTGAKIDNQNANVDEHSFGGRRGEFDSVVLKQFALDNCMSRMSKENHLNNEIYIHKLNCA